MKKLSKICLGAAAFLILSGGLLALTGHFMGAEHYLTIYRYDTILQITPFSIYGRNRASELPSANATVADAVYEWSNGTEVELEPFLMLDVDADLAEVSVVPSDHYGIALTWTNDRDRMDFSVEDGLLSVWNTNTYRGPGHKGGTITIYCPEETRFTSVFLRSALGSIDLQSIEAGDLTVEADLGSVTLSRVKAGSADLSLSLGDLKSTDFEVTGDLVLRNDMGSSQLRGTFRNMDLNSSMGSLTVHTSLPQSEYTWDLTADMGKITVDDQRSENENNGGSGAYRITAQCSMGDLDLSFG